MSAFTEHPKDVGMTYMEHLKFALSLSRLLFTLAMFSLVHAIFPFLLTKTVSTRIKELHMELSKEKTCKECCCCKDSECKCQHKECCCKK